MRHCAICFKPLRDDERCGIMGDDYCVECYTEMRARIWREDDGVKINE